MTQFRQMVDVEQDADLLAEQELAIDGGASESLFPTVERWLFDSSDKRNALEHVTSRDDMRPYRSIIDYLTCEVFPELQPTCFKFYKNTGPHMRELLTKEQLMMIETTLLQVLAYAVIVYESFYQHAPVPMSWREFCYKMRKPIGIYA